MQQCGRAGSAGLPSPTPHKAGCPHRPGKATRQDSEHAQPKRHLACPRTARHKIGSRPRACWPQLSRMSTCRALQLGPATTAATSLALALAKKTVIYTRLAAQPLRPRAASIQGDAPHTSTLQSGLRLHARLSLLSHERANMHAFDCSYTIIHATGASTVQKQAGTAAAAPRPTRAKSPLISLSYLRRQPSRSSHACVPTTHKCMLPYGQHASPLHKRHSAPCQPAVPTRVRAHACKQANLHTCACMHAYQARNTSPPRLAHTAQRCQT